MKEFKIEVPEGHEIDKEKSTFEKIVFKKKDELPNRWEDLKSISGYYCNDLSDIFQHSYLESVEINKNVFKTKEQAKASIALAQLSQLMYVYNEGWHPYWTDNTVKYVIHFNKGYLDHSCAIGNSYFLAFKKSEIRDKFLENFRDLIEKAKPLL